MSEEVTDDDDTTVISALDGLGVTLAIAFAIAGVGLLVFSLLRPRFPLFYKHNCLLDESEGDWVKQIPGRQRVLKQYQNKLGRKAERRVRRLKEKGIVSDDAPTIDVEAQNGNDEDITVVQDRNHNLHYIIQQGENRVREEVKMNGIIDLHWVMDVIRYKEEAFLSAPGGIDVVIYLRWLKYSALLLFLICLFSLTFLLSMFFISPNTEKLEGMTALSIARIEAGEPRLVVYVGAVWMYSFMIYYYCYRLNKDWAHLLRRDPSLNWTDDKTNIRMRTIMVENVPRKWARESDQFRQGMAQLFGEDNVTYAELAPKMAKTQKLKKDRRKLINRWKDAKSLLEEKGHRPMIHPNWMSFIHRRSKVDAITYLEKRIDEIDQNIDDSLALESNRGNSKVGFVTFSNYYTALQAATAVYDSRSNKFKAIRAPDPKDINWHNLHMSEEEILFRGIFTWVILIVVFIFWSTPILAIAALSTLDSLFTSNWVGDFFSGGNTAQVIASRIIPIVLLVIFLSFVPYLYALILYRRGYKVKSEEEVSILWAYFITLYVYIFLIPVFAGPLDGDTWRNLVQNTSSTIEKFANALTSNAGFIYQWLFIQATVEYAWFRCVRFHQFLLGVLPKWLRARAERAKRAAFNPVSFFYPKQYGRELLALSLGLSYCIMAPLVTPVALVYLLFAYLTAKNNFIFLYRAPIEGLALILDVIDIVLFVTFIWQVLMVGIFALKDYPGGYTIIFFAGFTIVFRFFLRHTFGKASRYVPLRYVPSWKSNKDRGEEAPIVAKYYVNPATHPRTSLEEEEKQRRIEQTQPYLTGIIKGEEPPTFPL